MLSEALITYVHYLGFMVLFAALLAQHWVFVSLATSLQIQRLFLLDSVYGAAAVVVLITGLSKVFLVGKPAIFYAHNGWFHAKVTLFVIVALLSIWPTLQFFKAKKASAQLPPAALIELPAGIRIVQRIELVIIMFLPLLAVLMARA